MKKQFKVDLTIDCDPAFIESLMELFAETADESGAVLTQYRYYVPKNERQS